MHKSQTKNINDFFGWQGEAIVRCLSTTLNPMNRAGWGGGYVVHFVLHYSMICVVAPPFQVFQRITTQVPTYLPIYLPRQLFVSINPFHCGILKNKLDRFSNIMILSLLITKGCNLIVLRASRMFNQRGTFCAIKAANHQLVVIILLITESILRTSFQMKFISRQKLEEHLK